MSPDQKTRDYWAAMDGEPAIRASASTAEGRLPGRDRSALRLIVRRPHLSVLATLLGASIGLGASLGAAPTYEATAVVVATPETQFVEGFGGLAEAAFSTDSVIQPVIDELQLNATPRQLLSSGRLQAEAVTDGPALRVLASSSDAAQTSDLANLAAESFATVAEENGIGAFRVFEAGDVAGDATPSTAIQLNVLQGTVAGGIVGISATLLLALFRPPVLTRGDAEREFPADAVFRARVRMRPYETLLPKGSKSGRSNVIPKGIGPAVAGQFEHPPGGGDSVSVSCVLVTSRGTRVRHAEAVIEELKSGTLMHAEEKSLSFEFTIVEWSDSRLAETISCADTVLVVVTEGTSTHALRDTNDEVRMAQGAKHRVLVFVS